MGLTLSERRRDKTKRKATRVEKFSDEELPESTQDSFDKKDSELL